MKSDERAFRFLQCLDDACIVVNWRAQVQFFNRAAEQLFGMSTLAIRARQMDDLLPLDSSSVTWQAILDQMRMQKSWQGHVVVSKPDGSCVSVVCIASDGGDETSSTDEVLLRLCEVPADEVLRKQVEVGADRKDAGSIPADDVKELELSDVIDGKALQSIFDDFFEITKTGVGIVDNKGKVLVAKGWQRICLDFHRVHEATLRNCVESDLLLSEGIAPGEFRKYRCKNQMWDMATPIFVSGQKLGALYLGQFFFEDELPDEQVFRDQAARYGFDEEAYLKALREVPRWSRRHVEATMRFYAKLAALISEQGFTALRLARSLHRVKLEQTARERSDARYRAYIDHAPYGVFVADAEGRYLEVNPAACQLTGYDESELLEMRIGDLIEPESVEQGLQHFQTVKREGYARGEVDYQTRDGQSRTWEVSAVRLSDDRFLGICDDTTRAREAEQALRLSEEKFSKAFKNAPLIMSISTFDEGRFIDVNQAFVRSSGYSREQVLGRTSVELGLIREQDRMDMLRAFQSGSVIREWQLDLIRADGSPLNCLFSGELIAVDGQPCLLASAVDMTERNAAEREKQRMEEQLRQAQKLESVGRLAGGVAHDFNNLLGGIMMRTELALERVSQSSPVADQLIQIKAAAQRSANLTRQLLAFARKQAMTPIVLNLNEVVSELLVMLQRLIGEDVSVRFKPGNDLGAVEMDPSQLDQILTNLCINARDAISGIGEVEIATSNVDVTSPDRGVPVGPYVSLVFRDNGCGIPKHALPHVFEPFFTTKDVGRGTGLGLAMAYGIVEQNRGKISVSSELGRGTQFEILLPRSDVRTPNLKGPTPGVEAARGETVLCVEDDVTILEPTIEILESLGYQVLSATSAKSAMALVQSSEREIHLLLTDVVMPEMNGRELAESLARMRPGLKCLFMSGYARDVIVHRGTLDPGLNLINKPFDRRQLAEKLRQVLDK